VIYIASQLRSIVSFSKTSGDTATPLTDFDVPTYEVNIHCYTNGVYYGDGNVMGAKIDPGDIAFFKNVNLRDIFIKNQNAGSNGSIYVVAAVPSDLVKKGLNL